MDFANDFEKKCFETCLSITSMDGKTVGYHNSIKAEKRKVGFPGNPHKEIDIISLDFPHDIKLLIRCMEFDVQEPLSAVQEWSDVVKLFNKHSIVSSYYGIVISAKGFSDDCQALAKAENLGLVPPYRDEKGIFSEKQIFRILERIIHTFINSISTRGVEVFKVRENFYWLCDKTTAGV